MTTTNTTHAAFLRAATSLRDAITSLRSVGKKESDGPFGQVMDDLERIHGVCVQLSRPQTVPAPEALAKVDTNPTSVPSPVEEPAKDSGLVVCKGCKAKCNPGFVTDGFCRKASCQAKGKPAAKAAAQTVQEPKAVAPKGETKPAAKGKPAAPKADGLAAYRKLVAECKAMGLSTKGKADELTARIAAAKAKPEPKTEQQTAGRTPKALNRLEVMADALGIKLGDMLAAAELAGVKLS